MRFILSAKTAVEAPIGLYSKDLAFDPENQQENICSAVRGENCQRNEGLPELLNLKAFSEFERRRPVS